MFHFVRSWKANWPQNRLQHTHMSIWIIQRQVKKNIWSIYLIIYSTFATIVCQQLMTPLLNVVYYFGKPNQWWQIDPIGNDSNTTDDPSCFYNSTSTWAQFVVIAWGFQCPCPVLFVVLLFQSLSTPIQKKEKNRHNHFQVSWPGNGTHHSLSDSFT